MARYGTRTDLLTGVLNQNGFEKNVSKVRTERSRDSSNAYCYCYFDIHNMKAVNLTYGKRIGDGVILALRDILVREFSSDIVGRLDDDHFIVYSYAQDLTVKLEAIREYCRSKERYLPFEFQVGVYRDNRGAKPDFAIECARLALQSIKSDHRQFVKFYCDAMSDEYLNRIYILNHIDQALSEHWIKVFYQPIIRSATGKASGLEALARWVDPDHGVIMPAQFLPIFEQIHLNAKLDLYIAEEVCREMKMCREKDYRVLKTSINLSPLDFESVDMAEEIAAIADRYNIDHEKLVIEISERTFDEPQKILQDAIRKFHANGFKVAVDNFGSGNSSLSVLKNYPFDIIKFDTEFIRDLDPLGPAAIIVKNLIQMARELGLRTVAEGIETGVQRDFLKVNGCECLQGFIFEKPRPLSYYAGAGVSEARNLTEIDQETEYYDLIAGVDYKKPYFGELPQEVAKVIYEGPWAVLEISEDKIVFVKSNQRYVDFLVREEILTKADLEKDVGQTWVCYRDNKLYDAVLESVEKRTWVSVADRLNEKQKITGYLYTMKKNPITGAYGVLLVVEEDK